jgi:hypothetical protein
MIFDSLCAACGGAFGRGREPTRHRMRCPVCLGPLDARSPADTPSLRRLHPLHGNTKGRRIPEDVVAWIRAVARRRGDPRSGRLVRQAWIARRLDVHPNTVQRLLAKNLL